MRFGNNNNGRGVCPAFLSLLRVETMIENEQEIAKLMSDLVAAAGFDITTIHDVVVELLHDVNDHDAAEAVETLLEQSH